MRKFYSSKKEFNSLKRAVLSKVQMDFEAN